MTSHERRLAALAAVFAPGRAEALLRRSAGPASAEAIAFAVGLAAAPRRERLEALARALAPDGAGVRAQAHRVAQLERPRVAALLRALGEGESPGEALPLLVRLCRERIGR